MVRLVSANPVDDPVSAKFALGSQAAGVLFGMIIDSLRLGYNSSSWTRSLASGSSIPSLVRWELHLAICYRSLANTPALAWERSSQRAVPHRDHRDRGLHDFPP